MEQNSENEKTIIFSNYAFGNYIVNNVVTKFTKEKKIRYILSKLDKLDNSTMQIILRNGIDIFLNLRIRLLIKYI